MAHYDYDYDKFGHNVMISTPYGIVTHNFLTIAGDGTGPYNHNLNYSDAGLGETDIYFLAPVDYYLRNVLVNISDDDKFEQEAYGAIGTALTNGISFWIRDVVAGPKIPLLGDFHFTKNYEWSLFTPNIQLIAYEDTLKSARTLLVDFDIHNEYGSFIHLKPGTSFGVTLHDDFSALVAHSFTLKGLQFF